MASRGPKGVVTRHVPDWLIARAMGGGRGLAQSAGNFAYVELTNNATEGSYLWVYWLGGFISFPSGLIIETWNKSIAVCPGSQGPIQPDQPLGPGLTGAFYSTVAVGNQMGELVCNSTFAQWSQPYPIAKLPPGYSIGLRSGNIGQDMTAGFLWIPITGQ